jgi:hypothetical protein
MINLLNYMVLIHRVFCKLRHFADFLPPFIRQWGDKMNFPTGAAYASFLKYMDKF